MINNIYKIVQKNKFIIVEIGVIFFFSLTPLLWLRGGEIILGHDANYHLNHFSRMISSMYSWNNSTYYGSDWTYDRGYLPINLVQGLFLLLTPSFSKMQSVFFVFLFFLLGMSFYICIKEIFPDRNYRWFRIFAGLFAMYNFFILQGWFTADTGRFLVFAGLPWYFLVIHKIFTRSWNFTKSILVFAGLAFFFNGNGLPPLVGAQAIIIGFWGVLYVLHNVFRQGLRAIFYGIFVAIAFAIIFCLINAYWLLPIFNFTSVSYSTDFSRFGGPSGTLAWEQMISKYASFSNLLRLEGLADWYENINHAYSHPFISNPILIIFSFLPITTILLGLITKNFFGINTPQKRFIVSALALLPPGLFLSAGTHPPLGKVYELCMRYIPGFVIFRSSLYKFGFLLWIPIIILFAYFANLLIQKLIHNSLLKRLTIGLVILWFIGFHYPYFYPDKIFHFNLPFKTRFVLPPYVTQMISYIDTNVPKSSRILLVPELDREYIGLPVDAYKWGYYSLMLLPSFISNNSYITDSESDRIAQMIYKSIYQSDNEIFLPLMNKIGASYLLFRRDVALSPGALKKHPVSKVEENVKQLSLVRLIKNIGEWSLYQVDTHETVKEVSALNSFDLLSHPGLNTPYLIAQSLSNPAHGVVRTFSDKADSLLSGKIQKEIWEAECYLCKKDEYLALVNNIHLPPVNALPGSWQYKRIQNKEKELIQLVSANSKERIDADLSFSGRRLAEMIKIMQSEKTNNQLPQLHSAYQDFLNDIQVQYKTLTGRDKNWYAIRISGYFESQLKNIAQYPLLKNETELLQSFIKEIKKDAWFTTDIASPKFGLTVKEEGYYKFYIPDKGVYYDQNAAYLSSGFHTFELTQINNSDKIQNEYPALFLESIKGTAVTAAPNISYQQKNPTKYIVHINNAVEPFVLRLNQKFDPRWKVYINQANNYLDDIYHLEIDGYANGWLIPKTGDFDLVINYWPQRIFYLGMMISVTSIGIIIISGLAIYLYANKKK